MARKLITNVYVDGRWYGPSYPDNEVTDEVAKKITNPKAWGDGGGSRRTSSASSGGGESATTESGSEHDSGGGSRRSARDKG